MRGAVMLSIDLKPGETVVIGQDKDIKVTLEEKKGQMARLTFEADRSIPITRVPRTSNLSKIAARDGLGKPKK